MSSEGLNYESGEELRQNVADPFGLVTSEMIDADLAANPEILASIAESQEDIN